MTDRPMAVAFLRRYTSGDADEAQRLAFWGRVIAPCDCDYEGCSGWQMTYPDEDVDGAVPVADLLDEFSEGPVAVGLLAPPHEETDFPQVGSDE